MFEQQPWCTFHPVSDGDRSIMDGLRMSTAPYKGKLRGTAARAQFDQIMGHVPVPEQVTFREDHVGGIPGWWCKPAETLPGATILHLHGGWFSLGSAAAYRHLVGHIARSAKAAAFVPDYRLAPEYPFPAALEDAKAVLDALAHATQHIAVTGDSAGGNLALGLLLAKSTGHSRPLPVACVILSPVTDLALTGASWETRAAAEPFFVKEQIEAFVAAYLNGHDPLDPMASPLKGSMAGICPLGIHVGFDEVLLDDSVRLAERAAAAGADVHLDVWEGVPHGFVSSIGQLRAADTAMSMIGAFLGAAFQRSATTA